MVIYIGEKWHKYPARMFYHACEIHNNDTAISIINL